MPGKTLTDSELVEAIKLDDQKAFNQLFERYWSAVYGIAYRYVKDEEAALEIAHDIFLNIWNKRCYLNINSFKNYVITAASYHGIRKKQTLKAVPIDYVEDIGAEYQFFNGTAQACTNNGEINILNSELEVEVNALLERLPKRCREIYIMSRQQNLSITEIAERINVSKRTVENQLTIALKHLRTSLEYVVIFILVFISSK